MSTNVGLVTRSVTPSACASDCVHVVFPAPRVPERASTVAPARAGNEASISVATSRQSAAVCVWYIMHIVYWSTHKYTTHKISHTPFFQNE